MNARLTDIESCINNLCNQGGGHHEHREKVTTSDVHLEDVPYIVLDQNVPNPFAEQTVIGYTLPEDIQEAQIIFYNLAGRKINSIELTERGNGELNVYADDLSSGIYTYSLIADGKVIDTKRMVKQ